MNRFVSMIMYILWILTIIAVLATTFTNFQYVDLNVIALTLLVFSTLNTFFAVSKSKG